MWPVFGTSRRHRGCEKLIMLLVIHPEHPEPRKIEHAASLIRDGHILAYPTDTGYGFGCDPFQRKAVERMFWMLSLPDNKLASFLCADFKQLAQYGYISDHVYRVARRIFPGPYTLILEATKEIPKTLRGKRKEVGIRVPNHPIPLALITALEVPLLNVSARDLQGDYLDDPHQIDEIYRKQLGAVIDGDLLPENPSTVIDLTGDSPQVIRVGQGDPDVFV